MKPSAPRCCRFLAPLCLIAAAALPLGLLGATAKKTNPASKIYVADLTGESQIDTGERIESLSKKSVYSAEGVSIETKTNASDSLVFSNGTALFVAPNTRFEVKKFLQEPFLPNRNDLDAEPSISQTIVKVTRGSIGICTSKLVAGSSMSYHTPHGVVNIRGRKIMIEVTDAETNVYLLEGDVTVLGDTSGAGQTLKPGQRATIRKSGPNAATVVSVEPIAEEQRAKLDENVSLACISRRTVFFDVVGRGEETEGEITPVEVLPATPDPGFTVSPARIGG